jgi:hypothetical protein
MEAVASSFTTTAAVIDIGSDSAIVCSNGDDVEGRNCNAEYSNGIKDGKDDCRSTSIFPDIGKNLATNSKISDKNGNSTNVSDANTEKVENLGNSESSKNTHVKNSVSVKNDNDYHSDDSKNINNLNEAKYNVNGSSNLNESTSSVIGSNSMIISTNISASNKRVSKRCTEIVQRSKAVPNSNIDSFDFDKEVIELRGLYKVSGSTVGLFRPLPPSVDNKKQNTVSNEW